MSERDTRYDINLRETLWKLRKKQGDRGEMLINRYLALDIQTIEIKNDQQSVRTGNVYIETECYNEEKNEWYPSGINTTQASVWVFIINEKPFDEFALQPYVIREIIKNRTVIQAKNTRPATKGVLIKISELRELYRQYCLNLKDN
jgi:hypothetical protein